MAASSRSFRSSGPSGTFAILMETNTPDFPAARRISRGGASTRIGRLSRRLAAAAALIALPLCAYAATGPVTVKGKTVGATKLLNPVWNEAKDPKLNRYTFREPSATVRPDVRTLTAHLPKELCVAALVEGEGKALKAPLRVVVAGGRTSPVTLVVAQGQQILFENQDPFPHKLYVTGADAKGFQATETAASKSRTWTPPGPGKYEIRDQLAPSLRSWIVVEPHVVSVGYPDRKGDFQIDLEPGTYKLRGYFNGEPVGTELPITVAPAPVEQPLRAPLLIGEGEAPPGGAPPGKQPPQKK
jgi:plastocyanin